MATPGRHRILMVTRNFPPLTGGMERLLHHVYLELAQEFEVALVAPRGSSAYAVGPVFECAPAPLPRFFYDTVRQGRRAVRALRPHLIFSGSGLTVFPTRRFAGPIPVATYVHGLDLVAPHPVYQHLFVPALRGCARVIANSSATRTLAIGRQIPPARVTVVHPGVQMPVPDPGARARARQALNLSPDAPVLLSVGRLSARKGLPEFLSQVLPETVQHFPDLRLLVVGDEPSGALAAEAIGAEARARCRALGLGDVVHFLGHVPDAVLEQAYCASDLHVFPVREVAGDMEGFGMVAVEAAAHGVPTLAFAAGGVVDAVREGVSGTLVTPGDYAAFTRQLRDYLSGRRVVAAADARAFAATFSWPLFGSRLRGICRDVIAASASGAASRSASL